MTDEFSTRARERRYQRMSDYRVSSDEAKKVINEGHIHKKIFGGEEYLIHFTKNKSTFDVYKLVGDALLEKKEDSG